MDFVERLFFAIWFLVLLLAIIYEVSDYKLYRNGSYDKGIKSHSSCYDSQAYWKRIYIASSIAILLIFVVFYAQSMRVSFWTYVLIFTIVFICGYFMEGFKLHHYYLPICLEIEEHFKATHQ